MTERERLLAVLAGEIPDKVPHFELDFQLAAEAFGEGFPDLSGYDQASEAEKERLTQAYLDMWEKVADRYHWAAVPVSLPLLPAARRRFEQKAVVFTYNGMGTFWMPPGDKIMDFVVDLFENPEKLHEEAKRKCRESIELAKMQADAGAEFICINSDYGFNDGPFISPTMFAEFVTPYLTEIVGAIHDLGLKAILHSDGDLRKILDQLVSTGLDGYQSIDPQGHMDIAQVKAQYGDRLILMGNVRSAALQDSDPEIIRESVRYAIKNGKPGGRYIFSTSNCIFAGMPLENYHIMLDEYEKLAYYTPEEQKSTAI